MTQVQTPPNASTPAAKAPGEARLLIAVVAGWLLPGLGHMLLGKQGKAVAFFVVVTGCFFTGIAVGGSRIVSATDDRLAFYAQVLNGAMGIGYNRYAATIATPLDVDHRLEIGRLYTSVAGLLNLLIVLNAWSTHHQMVEAARQQQQLTVKRETSKTPEPEVQRDATG